MCLKKRQIGFSIGLLAMVALLGCAASHPTNDSGTTGPETALEGALPYYPNIQAGVTLDDAKRALALLLEGRTRPVRVEFGPRYSPKLVWKKEAIELVKGVQGYTAYTYETDSRVLKSIALKNIAVLDDHFALSASLPIYFADLLDAPIIVKKGLDKEFPCTLNFAGWVAFQFQAQDLRDALRFADHLFVLQQPIQKQQAALAARFESQAAHYRSMQPKPRVSEEQRKYIVQANALNQRKEYVKAIDLYLKANDLDPISYPGAYFNLALLYAQTDRYNKAIVYMKQYLLLEPDAKDARGAQDKIYEWELMLQGK